MSKGRVTIKKAAVPVPLGDRTPSPDTARYRVTGIAGVDNPLAKRVVSNAFESEDEFKSIYASAPDSNAVIEPPYNMKTLDRLAQENNALMPCIEAMVTNIDGTGFDFAKDDWGSDDKADKKTDPHIKALWDFFQQPWPGESFITQRKKLRRDIERTGNGYLEVLTNAQGEIIFTRHIDAKITRLVRLDGPTDRTMKIKRGGKEITVKAAVRERRYCQVVSGKTLVYFKEFGSQRDLDLETGAWAEEGKTLPAPKRASALIHFRALPDAHTPYGVPRWISQLPSVLGSRKAEEFNLDFFENGGVPPVLILIQGGVLAGETRKALTAAASGGAAAKSRVQVVEMEPTGGTLDNLAPSKVTVERFGSERQNDSMFEKYDDKCEVRVRRAFRLPPIFVGQADDYSFATAFASYTVAEAQVFRPERDEFDEVMSVKFIPALGHEGYLMQSNPMNIEDATLKLQALEVAVTTNQVDPISVLDTINEITGLNLKKGVTNPLLNQTATTAPGGSTGTPGKSPGKGTTSETKSPPGNEKTVQPVKATPTRNPAVRKTADELADLAVEYIKAVRENDSVQVALLKTEIEAFDEETKADFDLEMEDLKQQFHVEDVAA